MRGTRHGTRIARASGTDDRSIEDPRRKEAVTQLRHKKIHGDLTADAVDEMLMRVNPARRVFRLAFPQLTRPASRMLQNL